MDEFETRQTDHRVLESRPVSELIGDALQQFSRLVRTEAALARAEVYEKVNQAVRGSMMLAFASIFGIASLVILMMALAVFLVEIGVAPALSYLISAVVGFVISGLFVMAGLNALRANSLLPDRTINQLHRDVRVMKEQVRSK